MLVPLRHPTFSRGIMSLNDLAMGHIHYQKAGMPSGGKIAYHLLHANHKSRTPNQVYPVADPLFSSLNQASNRTIPASVDTCSRYPSTVSAR